MDGLAELIGESPAIAAVREQVAQFLQRRLPPHRLPPILLQGETGSGKGLLARLIHRTGPRVRGPFVDINCAAIPETLLEAELFGYERGAFTDARQAKPGLFQTANGGTIFLDEIALLPLSLQAKLLKVVEEREVRRLGSTRSEPVDIWVLTASNQDLLGAARAQRFREDLYHRLAVLTLRLPPLRDRGRDILLLAQHFLARACADYGLPSKTFAADAQAALMAYRWPGNIRELGNVIERVALLARAAVVAAEALGLPTRSQSRRPATPQTPLPTDPGEGGFGARRDSFTGSQPRPPQPGREGAASPVVDPGAETEREQLLEALARTNWNIARTAAARGISRNVLRYRIEKHGLRRGEGPAPGRPDEAPKTPPLPTDPAEAPTDTPVLASPVVPGVRWEQRRLAWLRAALRVAAGDGPAGDSSRWLEIVMGKVETFGGHVEEVSATGIVAAFGLEPVEDAPGLAALAGLAIQKAAERARRNDGERFTVTVAIHVGPFMVARIGGATAVDQDGKREAWAILDGLIQAGEPGSVLASEAGASLLERRFDCVAVESRAPAPGGVYRLSGPERAGLAPDQRMTRFVGRQRELDLLGSRFALAMRGHGQVVGIVGEAGIGKSRLLFEFRQSLRRERVTYLEGRCVSHGSAIPYLPVIQMLRRTCRLTERDTPKAIVEKVNGTLAHFGIEPRETAPYLLHFLGLSEGTEGVSVLSPEAIQSRTFEILRQMSLTWARRRPLILAIENLHWTDRSTDAYLVSMVETLAGAPILLLMTYRPGYRPRWMDRSYATQIALPPLLQEESLRVVHAILPAEETPEPLAERIVGKAEGNPFFLEELARAVRENPDFLEAPSIPDTIEQVIRARIDRLPDAPRQLLQTASVLGREIPLRLLRAIWRGSGDIEAHLRELTRLEFLVEPHADEDPVYVFKHALTQDVAYESLPSPRRQALHATAGQALEALYADRLEEALDRLAYHYARTPHADRAVAYLGRVADRAARAFAHVEAATALKEALVHIERLEADEDRDRLFLGLVLRLARSLNHLGRYEETLSLLRRARERVEPLDDPSLSGPYHFWLSRTHSTMGDYEQGARGARRALEEAERCRDEGTMGKAYFALAYEEFWEGRPLEGVRLGEQALALLDRPEERWWLAMAHWVVGINQGLLGDFDAALATNAQVQKIGETMGDSRLQSSAAWTEGSARALRGEWEEGIATCRRGVELCTDPVDAAVARGFLGGACLEKGDAAEAIPLLEQSVQQCSRFGVRRVQGWFTALLSNAYLLSGQLDKARTLAHEGLRILGETRNSYGTGWAQRTLGRIARASGQLDEASAHLGEALQTFAATHARFEIGRTHLELAEVHQARGDRERAASHLSEARNLFASLRVPIYEARARQLATALAAPAG